LIRKLRNQRNPNPNPRRRGRKGRGSYLGPAWPSLGHRAGSQPEPSGGEVSPPRGLHLGLGPRASPQYRSTVTRSPSGERTHRQGDSRRRYRLPQATTGGHRRISLGCEREQEKGRKRTELGFGGDGDQEGGFVPTKSTPDRQMMMNGWSSRADFQPRREGHFPA
jgi:hypothetical protein